MLCIYAWPLCPISLACYAAFSSEWHQSSNRTSALDFLQCLHLEEHTRNFLFQKCSEQLEHKMMGIFGSISVDIAWHGAYHSHNIGSKRARCINSRAAHTPINIQFPWQAPRVHQLVEITVSCSRQVEPVLLCGTHWLSFPEREDPEGRWALTGERVRSGR